MTTTTEFARTIRVSTVKMVAAAKSSHVGSCFSMADIIAVLYNDVLHVDPSNPDLASRDRFILSKGHACAIVYAALAHKGFFDVTELENYAANGSRLMAHISHRVPGVEFSTGSLGHGVPFGVGKALAAKSAGSSWRTFVVVGDGEMDEGSNWEALLFAAHHNLSNIVITIDANNLQSLTTTTETLNLGPLRDKLESFGAKVIEVDGHNIDELREAYDTRHMADGKPIVVIAHTTKGKGVDYMENKVEWHYRSPDETLLAEALRQLGEMS